MSIVTRPASADYDRGWEETFGKASGRTVDYAWDAYGRCNHCGELLRFINLRTADGCPCSSGRGINHGIVPKNTCTCSECDPAKTGSTRWEVIELRAGEK